MVLAKMRRQGDEDGSEGMRRGQGRLEDGVKAEDEITV